MSQRHRRVGFAAGEARLPSLASLSLNAKSTACDAAESSSDSSSDDDDPANAPPPRRRMNLDWMQAEAPPAVKRERSSGSLDGSKRARAAGIDEDDSPAVVAVVMAFDGVLTTAENLDGAAVQHPMFGATGTVSSNAAAFRLMTHDQHIRNFGGQRVVDALHTLFKDLADNDIQPIIIASGGTRDGVDSALTAAGLRSFFEAADDSHDLVEVYAPDVAPMNGQLVDDETGEPGEWETSHVIEWFMDNNPEWTPPNIMYVGDPAVINAPEVGVNSIGEDGNRVTTYMGPRTAEDPGAIFDTIRAIRQVTDVPENWRDLVSEEGEEADDGEF